MIRKNSMIWRKIVFFALALLLFITTAAVIWKRQDLLSKIGVENVSVEVRQLSVECEIKLPDATYFSKGAGFTCTGLAYDPVERVFWVGNYGKENAEQKEMYPSIIKISSDFSTILGEIDIRWLSSSQNINLQGIAYDNKEDNLWFVDGKKAIHISKDGERIGEISLDEYERYSPNGITYDNKTDTLWILLYSDYLINITRDGDVLTALKCNYQDQDQICMTENGELYFSVGADYYENNNYICKINHETGEIEIKYQLIDSYAVEGIAVVDEQLYIMNDGLFHSAAKSYNYVNIYNFDQFGEEQ